MSPITIPLSAPLDEWVRRKVEGGQFEDAADYVRDLIRRDLEASAEQRLSVADIRDSIGSGRRDGVRRPASAVFDDAMTRLTSI